MDVVVLAVGGRGRVRVVRALLAGAVALLTGVGALAAAPAASAATPSNDDATGATQVAALPFAATTDLQEATGSADEVDTIGRCEGSDDQVGARAVGVWYRYTPSVTRIVHADVSGDAVVLLVTGSGTLHQPPPATDGACDAVGTTDGQILRAGTTYSFLVFGFAGHVPPSTTLNLVDSGCAPPAGSPHDLDGDGCPDLAVAQPRTASVDVHLGNTMQSLDGGVLAFRFSTQPGAGERMSLAVGRTDTDGYPDLVVGLPGLDVGDRADAGGVVVVFGSPQGLGHGRTTQLFTQATQSGTGTPEAGDRFGAAVAVRDAGGVLAVGSPGEAVGTTARAGAVCVLDLSGGGGRVLSQSGSQPGTPHTGDAYGSAVAYDGSNLLVGVPLDNLGSHADAGSVTVVPASGAAYEVTQDSSGMPGSAEAGDRFGSAFAVLTYGDGTRVAIGVPGESVGAVARTGMVSFLTRARGTARLLPDPATLHQGTAHVPGANESGDHFGAVLAGEQSNVFAIPWPSLVVGVPDEDLGDAVDAGGVVELQSSVDSLSRRAPFTRGQSWSQSNPGAPGAAESGDRFGASLAVLPGDTRVDEDRSGSIWAGVPGEDAGALTDTGSVQRADDVEPTAGDVPERVPGLATLAPSVLAQRSPVAHDRYGSAVG